MSEQPKVADGFEIYSIELVKNWFEQMETQAKDIDDLFNHIYKLNKKGLRDYNELARLNKGLEGIKVHLEIVENYSKKWCLDDIKSLLKDTK